MADTQNKQGGSHFAEGFVPAGGVGSHQHTKARRMAQPAFVSAVPDGGEDPKKEDDKKRKRRNLISNILLVIGLIFLLVAGGIFIFQQISYKHQDEINAKLASYVSTVSDEQRPDAAPTVDWAGLKAINPDVVAWINIPDTVINYPIYQGPDNDKYLRHDAEGNWSLGGQIFMDYQNRAPGLIDNQTLIYGHHMKNDSMFQYVATMVQQDTFDRIKTVWYLTEQGATELQPVFIYDTPASNLKARTFNFSSQQEQIDYFMDSLNKAEAKDEHAEAIIKQAKHFVTLVTCKEYYGDGRTLLICVPKSEAQVSS